LLRRRLVRAAFDDELTARGTDVSAAALALSKKRLVNWGDRVHWYEEDVTRFRPPNRFSLWHDRAVFHFLTGKTDRQSYVNVLKQSLEPGGHLIMLTFALDGPARCSGLDIVQYDADKLCAELGTDFELVESGREIHFTPSGKQQNFAYFWLINTQEPCI